MLLSIGDEIIYVWTDGFHATLHRWDGIALTLNTDPITQYRTETETSYSCSSSAMHASQIAAKYKYLVVFQSVYPLWSDSVLLHFFHINHCLFFIHSIFSCK